MFESHLYFVVCLFNKLSMIMFLSVSYSFYSNILDSGGIFFWCSFLYKISFPWIFKRKIWTRIDVCLASPFRTHHSGLSNVQKYGDKDMDMDIECSCEHGYRYRYSPGCSLFLLCGYCFLFTFFITFLTNYILLLAVSTWKGSGLLNLGFTVSILPTGPLKSPTD